MNNYLNVKSFPSDGLFSAKVLYKARAVIFPQKLIGKNLNRMYSTGPAVRHQSAGQQAK